MGSKPSKKESFQLLTQDEYSPPNIKLVHIWKLRCITENRYVYYVGKECPIGCPYSTEHEIDLKIKRMKPSELVM